ncbi:MAG: hypothetical protein OMM_05744 [Candidatus Magnetoglobus multicellularis str. Araruama]|uniref:Uncharacterized protein n=1 Tax=Candidatus Magnetoglobus multicellularis str. Araruama TaxID=890399 RepID=A0A1V1NUK6_9BACT|nr:MAG: hypothetical protein OMM_05744 [Candidatus Magnetoglobus multicellularis str. Araruama]
MNEDTLKEIQDESYLKKLRSNFESLTNTEQLIVLIISLIYTSTTRTILLKCFVKLDIRNPKGTRYQSHTLVKVLQKLIDLKLIRDGSYPASSKTFADYALQIAFESDKLEPVANALEDMEKSGQILTNKRIHKDARTLRLLRLAYFNKDYDTLETLFIKLIHKSSLDYIVKNSCDNFFQVIMHKPFKGKVPDSIRLFYIHKKLVDSIITLAPCDKELEDLVYIYNKSKKLPQKENNILALHCIYRAQFGEAASLLASSDDNYEGLLLKGFLAYLTGNGDAAIKCFQTALNNENDFPNEIINVLICFYLAELLRQDSTDSFDQIEGLKEIVYRKIDKPYWLSNIYEIFEKSH